MDGFALFNLIQCLPYKVHAHNIGSVQSIANIVFLGADIRTCAPESSFMFHGFSWTFQQESLDEAQISERTNTLSTGRAEYVRVFESRTNWKQADFDEQKLFDRAKVILPDAAKDAGIVHDITHVSIPPGVTIINVTA